MRSDLCNEKTKSNSQTVQDKKECVRFHQIRVLNTVLY